MVSCPVRSEQSQELASCDFEVDARERGHRSESFGCFSKFGNHHAPMVRRAGRWNQCKTSAPAGDKCHHDKCHVHQIRSSPARDQHGWEEQAAHEGSHCDLRRCRVRECAELHSKWECDFESPSGGKVQLCADIEKRIEKQFGFRPPVILRTAKQLRDVVDNNPFLKAGAAPDTLHVMFLAERPNADAVSRLDPHRSPPDEFMVQGQEIDLRLPAGVAPTKLTNAYFDAKLKTISTGRNWRTVNTLLEMMSA